MKPSTLPVNRPILRRAFLLNILFFLFLPVADVLSSESESFILTNGLRVIFKKDSSSSLAALQLGVETGAADEATEEAGIAHVLEHILFRGSSERGTGKFAGEVESLGGTMNGFTSHDRTVYYMVVPAAHAKSALGLLARMMRLPTLDESQLQKEIQVVLEEWKQGEDNPRSKVSRALFQTAYQLHPYGRPVIGTPESLKRITWESLTRLYQRWYSARNMTLVVVGNLDSETVRRDIIELFSSLPGPELPSHPPLREVSQERARLTVLKAPVQQAHLMIGFPIPNVTERAAPALDLLAFILGRGESSRLLQRVKTAGGLVNSISASTFSPKGPGLFLIQAQLETHKVMDALRATLKELYVLREEVVSAAELNRAYINFERTFIETKETVLGQARQMGNFQLLYGNPDYEEVYLKEIRELDAEKLKSAARAFFRTETLVVSLLVPEETADLPSSEKIADLSRSLQNAVTVKHEQGILKATLENGLRILIQENHRLPVFSVHAGLIGGLILEDEGNNGIHNFIASMLTQGTPRLSSSQLIQGVEELGGSLSGSAGNSTLSLSGTFPSQQVERGLELFLEVLLNPTFPEEELEKKRREILIGIKNREEQVRNQAYRLFYQTLFQDHPYRLRPSGEREQILRFSREDLITHYRNLISSDRIVLVIVGDVDGEKILSHLRSRLSSLPKFPSKFSLSPSENGIGQMLAKKKTTKRKQAHLVLGFAAPTKGKPDYFTMKVVQMILSAIGGRLFVELRDKQGLAYSVGAFSLDDPLQGAFGTYAATDPANIEKVREGILGELRRLQDEEVSTKELERAKNYLIGNYLITRQTNASKAADLTFNELFGFGTDFDQRYQEGIQKVSAADIVKFAREHLPLDRYVLAIVGP
jgi:zinc protease